MTITFAPTRRDVLKIAGATLAISNAAGRAALAQAEAGGSKVKAIGFDAFTIFDPRSIEAAVEDIFPGKGKELAAGWRTRLFEYTWLRTLNRTYADFRQVSDDALKFVFKAAKIELKPDVSRNAPQRFCSSETLSGTRYRPLKQCGKPGSGSHTSPTLRRSC